MLGADGHVVCVRAGVSGCQILDGAPCGVYVEDSSNVLLSGTTIARHEAKNQCENMIRWKGTGQRNLISGCQIDSNATDSLAIDDEAGVSLESNLLDP